MSDTVRIKPLAVEAEMFGTVSKLFPVLIWDETSATLVDTGYPGIFAAIRRAIEQVGVPFGRLKRVILTHQDWDHTGTLPDILAAGESVESCAHRLEKPYIERTVPDYKLTPDKIAARIAALPAEMRPKATALFASLPSAPVNRTLEDGEILPWYGGLEVIHVPGHTPGNICLYHKDSRTLIAGDQFRVVDGALVGPAPEYTPDMPAALASLKKLAAYDIGTVCCYHGGPYGPSAGARIVELAKQ